MQSKTVIAAIFISTFLISLVAGMQVVEVAKANPMYNVKPAYEFFTVSSPQNNSSCEGLILLNFTVKTNAPSDMHDDYAYKIDQTNNVLVYNITVIKQTLVTDDVNPHPESGEGIPNPNPPYYIPYTDYVLEGKTVLPPLLTGWHNLTVGRATSLWKSSDVIRFYVNTTLNISSTSPSPTSSSSSTQQPTLEPSPTLDDIQAENFTPTIIMFGLVALAVVIGVLVYFKKIKK